MSQSPFLIKPLEKEDRSGFACGKESLDHYFQKQIGQDVRRSITTAFISVHRETETIAGYYTLSASEIPFTNLEDDWRKKLPRYPTLPAVRVGRLAIDQRFQGQGLGSALLADATARTLRSDIGAHFLIVEALDQEAIRFYEHLGLRQIPDTDNRLFIPLSVLEKLV